MRHRTVFDRETLVIEKRKNIFKLETRDVWEAACAAGRYDGSDHDRRDGFIHFSTAEQLLETARKHFSGRTGLFLIAVRVDALGVALRWEPSRGGALFPHLYAPLQTGSALWSEPVDLDAAGIPDVLSVLRMKDVKVATQDPDR